MLVPIEALRDEGSVVVNDFTTLVEIWRRDYGALDALHALIDLGRLPGASFPATC